MTQVRVRGETVRRFIIEQVVKHPADIARLTAETFGITRQAVNKHLQTLVAEGTLIQQGNTKSRSYQPALLVHWEKTYLLSDKLEEDRVWRDDVVPSLGQMPRNVLDIWHYGFTEMFNNAIDHSEGTRIRVELQLTAVAALIAIDDNGIGIFKKIQTALGLIDVLHAVLELAKGKLTTDSARHTGEGIFFTSRMFDHFEILSGEVSFSHQFDDKEDWIVEKNGFPSGTSVRMKLSNHTTRTDREVFDQFTSGNSYGFTKTIVPVRLAQYGDENLVSRSQAKRLLVRVDRFETVILDFQGVESIGQAFADEIFRVFTAQHPKIELLKLNANSAVERMISRARSGVES